MEPSSYNHLLEQATASNLVLRTLLVATQRRHFQTIAAKGPTVSEEPSFTRRDSDLIFTHSYESSFSDESSEAVVLTVRAVYEVALYCEQSLPDEFAEEYMRRQLPLLTRPYFRELLSNCTARSLVQAPTLAAKFVPPINKPAILAESKVIEEVPKSIARKPRKALPPTHDSASG